MKLNKLYFIFISFIILLSSCSNEIEENNTLKNEPTTLKIRVQSSARTVLPQTVAPEELTDFLLTGKINNNSFYYCSGWNSDETFEHYNQNRDLYDFGRKYSSLSDLQNEKIKLIPEEWVFTLTAKKGGTTYKAEKTHTIVQGENTISFNLTLDDTGQEKGAFSLSLDFAEADNASKVTSASASLQNIDGTAVTGFHTQTLSVSSGKVTYSEDQLPVGSYRALITLYSDNLELLTWREIIVISSDLVSSAERKLDSLNLYRITYKLNDDEDNKAIISSPLQENYTRSTISFLLPTLTRPHYKFMGWFENEDFSGEICTCIDTARLENLSLYAKWEAASDDSSLSLLKFEGERIKIYDNDISRTEIPINSDVYEYYIEYKSLKINFEKTDPKASFSINIENDNFEVLAEDSTMQDIYLTVLSEDKLHSTNYIFHTVYIFNYDEACIALKSRTKNIKIKFIDESLPEKFYSYDSSSLQELKNSIISSSTEVFLDFSGLQITTIKGYNKFEDCTEITGLRLPATFKDNLSSGFDGCCLHEVHYDGSLEEWLNIPKFAFGLCKKGADLYINGELVENIIIPDSIEAIPDYLFYNCTSLKSIVISNNVKTIGYRAFYGCTALTDVLLSNSLTKINGYMFGGCTTLKSITLPSSITFIGQYAFYNCNNLSRVEFDDKESIWYKKSTSSNEKIGKLSDSQRNATELKSGVLHWGGYDLYSEHYVPEN